MSAPRAMTFAGGNQAEVAGRVAAPPSVYTRAEVRLST